MEKLNSLKKIMHNLLFLDIETVSCTQDFSMMSLEMQALWIRKAQLLHRSHDVDHVKEFKERGAIYSEFGRIIVIAIGYVRADEDNKWELKVKALLDEEEEDLLNHFKDLVEKFDQDELIFCGHNIKEFDLPYLCRRMIVNKINLPVCLNSSGKKPWEIRHLDTMEMWSFGDRKNFTSLHLLSTILGIKSSKEIMEGSEVHGRFYDENNMESIANYCRGDVSVVAQIYFRMRNSLGINLNKIIFV